MPSESNHTVAKYSNTVCLLLEYTGDEDWLEEIVKFLNTGGDVNTKCKDDDWTLLHGAAQAGNLKAIRLLIENGADINAKAYDGCTPLHTAIVENIEGSGNLNSIDFKHVSLLIELGADQTVRNSDGYTPAGLKDYYHDPEFKSLIKSIFE